VWVAAGFLIDGVVVVFVVVVVVIVVVVVVVVVGSVARNITAFAANVTPLRLFQQDTRVCTRAVYVAFTLFGPGSNLIL
jgi:hypothetical protein